MDNHSIKVIARIKSDFPTKFGIPRQSGLAASVQATVIFESEFRNADALRGIVGYSHLWLIWQFSEAVRSGWSPTVRPPRLGGNTRMGVFAIRSPFRPNNLGLSSVKLVGVEETAEFGTVLHVSGADLMDGTPIYDVKPYIPYTDSHPEAIGGFTDTADNFLLDVEFPEDCLNRLPEEKHKAVLEVLAHDPRPSYHDDPDRIYGMTFAGYNIRFTVSGKKLQVLDTQKTGETYDH